MKKFIFVFLTILLTGCSSQEKYTDFDYSYSRSGGIAPFYENLLIKGRSAHYSLEGQGKSIKKDFKISPTELLTIQNALTENKFRSIREDYNKMYDNVATIINAKKGNNSAIKSDASAIMEPDRERWENVANVFRQIIATNINTSKK